MPVRGGQSVTGDLILDDYECPFGVLVQYTVGSATDFATLDVPDVWLTHPTDPTRSMAVTLVDDDEYTWSAPGTVHEPLDSAWPQVVWRARTVHQGQLVVVTSWAQRADMKRLVADGSPLLLRVPPGCTADDLWLWPSAVSRRKVTPHNPAAVVWALAYQRVDDPAGEVTFDPSNAWAAVVVTHPSWTDLMAAHADWVDVQLTPHPHA